jgi:hypothetical protein
MQAGQEETRVTIYSGSSHLPISQLKQLAVAQLDYWTSPGQQPASRPARRPAGAATPSTVNPVALHAGHRLINNGRLDDGSSVIRALNTSLIPPIQALLHADMLLIMTSG